MALLTPKEIRDELLQKKPTQWIISFQLAGNKIEDLGFKSLKDFATADVGAGGLGMDMGQIKKLIEYNPKYKHIADKILGDLGEGVGVANEDGVRCYETEKVTPRERGNSQDYKISKLKRDFGEEEVMEAIKDNGYTKATQVERHFGVGTKLKTDLEKVITAHEKLSREDKETFLKIVKNEVN